MRKFIEKISILGLIGLLVITACEKEDIYPDLIINKTELKMAVKDTSTIMITSGSGEYSVKSNDKSIATATLEGNKIKITAESEGNTQIIVKDKKANKTVKIPLTIKYKDIDLEKTEEKLTVFNTKIIKIIAGSGLYDIEIYDEGIATAILRGNNIHIRGEGVGTTKIIVKDKKTNKKKTITVTVYNNIYVEGNFWKKVFLFVNETKILTITSGTGKYTVQSKDDNIAKVSFNNEDSTITVKGILEGTTEIIITDIKSTQKKVIPVKIEERKVEEITVTPKSGTLMKGETVKLKAIIKPTNATYKKVKWSSNKTSVATVDEKGKVKAIAQGVAVITATTEKSNEIAKCTITVINPLPSPAESNYIEITTQKAVGESIELTIEAKEEDKARVWIDLNGNSQKDIGEDIIRFWGRKSYKLGKQTIRIYGKITYLDCNKKNKISRLDVSNNKTLTKLNCSDNQLINLNVSKNITLKELSFYYNQLTNLDLSNNKALTKLDCSCNELANLDVSNNKALIELECLSNQLTDLDISNNIELKELDCSGNELISLDMSNNAELEKLFCDSNKLVSLNVSQNTKLTVLVCDHNQLANLDIHNNKALISLGCLNNDLTSLDISNNKELKVLYCGRNKLTSLDLSNNKVLQKLSCIINKLTNLDISNNRELDELYCRYNQLASLDISNNTKLNILDCYNNKLKHLNMSNNKLLERLDCSRNELISLNIANGNNANIEIMEAKSNPNLTCIQHDAGFDPTTKPCEENFGWCKDDTAQWSTGCK